MKTKYFLTFIEQAIRVQVAGENHLSNEAEEHAVELHVKELAEDLVQTYFKNKKTGWW